jgi:hypothetical protein
LAKPGDRVEYFKALLTNFVVSLKKLLTIKIPINK